MSDWTAHAAELARSIGAVADIRDRRWLAAVEQVPRHLFVPRWYERSRTGWVAAAITAPDPRATSGSPAAGPPPAPPVGAATAAEPGAAVVDRGDGRPGPPSSAAVDTAAVDTARR